MNSLWWTRVYIPGFCLFLTTLLSVDAQSGVAPYFTLRPANQTVHLHVNVRLDCHAYGVPTPTKTWVKYTDGGSQTVIQTGGRYIVGSTIGYLYILQIHWSDAGRYGCIAQNEHGRDVADAHVAVVTVSAPSWDIKPYNVTLYERQQYTLPCKAHGYPDPTYVWMHKGSAIADNSDMHVLPNNYLHFASAQKRHRGGYRCTVSNYRGTISHLVYVDVVADPSIVIEPEDVPTVRGGKITLSCGVVGSATVKVKWMLNDSNLPDDTRISFTSQTWGNVYVHTLNIKKARRRHLGLYHCMVQNAIGNAISRTAEVYFSNYITPLQVEVPKPAVMTLAGSNVELLCVFIGSPTPLVTWYKDGGEVNIGTPVLRTANTRSEAILKLINVKHSYSGHYVCVGDSSFAGTAKGNVSLVVIGRSAPDIKPLNQYKEAKKNTNITLQFFVMGAAEPDITWYKDGKQLENSGSTRLHDVSTYSAELNITSAQYSDSGLYTCTAENQFGTSSANVTLAVKGIPDAPMNVTVEYTSRHTVLVSWVPGHNGGTSCTFSVQFKRSGTTAWTSSDAILGNATSTVLSNSDGWNGQFVFRVTAANQFGSSESSEVPVTLGGNIVTQKHSDKDSTGAIVGGVVGGLLAILLVIAVVLIMCRKKNRKKAPPNTLPSAMYTVVSEEDQYTYADPNANQSTQDRCDTYSYVTVRPDATTAMAVGATGEYTSIPRPKQWEVPKRNVRLDKKLGSGHFGLVMKGFLKTKQGNRLVAVKMLLESADQQQKKEFLAELELMKAMAPHPNIVGLVGCCTKSEEPFIIVEYCSLGNLKDFLRSSHGSVVYANMAGNSLTLTNRDLLSFAWQCARGMSYLASQKLVHRDLAARNILVDDGNVCKIADFGLARDIYEKKLYLKTGEGELPLRWMALESIFQGITTTKSDVWSYGILLWEIVTLGANPYPGMYRDQLIDQLRDGYRMPKPQYCSDELYAIMWQCWQHDPESRPTFMELGKTLHRLMTAQKISIDLNNFDVSYINATEEQ